MPRDKETSQFHFELFRLPQGVSAHSLAFSKAFFEEMEQDLLQNGEGKAHITIEKSELLLSFTLAVSGKVELTCDRTLKTFWQAFEAEDTLYFKFGEENQELDYNLFVIERDTHRLELGRHLFDLIATSLPTKRYHPDFEEPEHQETATNGDPKVFSTAKNETNKKATSDPRWDKLEQLKKQNHGTS